VGRGEREVHGTGRVRALKRSKSKVVRWSARAGGEKTMRVVVKSGGR